MKAAVIVSVACSRDHEMYARLTITATDTNYAIMEYSLDATALRSRKMPAKRSVLSFLHGISFDVEPNYLPEVRCVPMLLNVVVRLVPRRPKTPMRITAMREAIRPYSIAVTPRVSARNLLSSRVVVEIKDNILVSPGFWFN